MADGPLESSFANYLEVGHNELEFVLAFGQAYSDEGDPTIHIRVVTGPPYAKEFCRVLAKSIEEYEAAYRPIKTDE